MKYKGKAVNKHRYRQLTKSRNNRRERLANHNNSFYPDVLDWYRKERDKYESLEEDKVLAEMYGEDIIKAETDRSNAKVIEDVKELFDQIEDKEL